METAFALRNKANAAAAAGDIVGAAAIYAQAVRSHPHNADLLNSAGSFHTRFQQNAEALRCFERALAVDPAHVDARLNRAIVLSQLGRRNEAIQSLQPHEGRLGSDPRYWTIRAAIERELCDFDAAAASYDVVLAREPNNLKALNGRARVALERGEAMMCHRYEQALRVSQATPDAWLGYAQALDYSGRHSEARQIAEQLANQAPGWSDAQEFLATLRWAAGEHDKFCDHFEAAAAKDPRNLALYISWSRTLSGVDRAAEAASVLRHATVLLPHEPMIALADATYSSEAGDLARADGIFAAAHHDDPAWQLQEARHRLRKQQPERAVALLEQVIAAAPDTIAAWSLMDFAWRILGDARATWLHGQEGLVRKMSLNLQSEALGALIALLDRLHDETGLPIGHGQTVRGGSQTRGGLFQRMEPEIRQVHGAIRRMIDDYRGGLPPSDANHPLLRHRDSKWTIRGSWSVRMRGHGRHVEHIHPQGVLSSAAYLVLPDDVGGSCNAGHLELGRSPTDLLIDLPPVHTIAPEEGYCALFPSTLFHGTRPFADGKRMTIAFDVSLAG